MKTKYWTIIILTAVATAVVLVLVIRQSGDIEPTTENQKSATSTPLPETKLIPADMKQAAEFYVKAHSVSGLTFNLELMKMTDRWAMLRVKPLNMEIDEAMMIMEKVNGKWVARDIGTAFPQWVDKAPELFN